MDYFNILIFPCTLLRSCSIHPFNLQQLICMNFKQNKELFLFLFYKYTSGYGLIYKHENIIYKVQLYVLSKKIVIIKLFIVLVDKKKQNNCITQN